MKLFKSMYKIYTYLGNHGAVDKLVFMKFKILNEKFNKIFNDAKYTILICHNIINNLTSLVF